MEGVRACVLPGTIQKQSGYSAEQAEIDESPVRTPALDDSGSVL